MHNWRLLLLLILSLFHPIFSKESLFDGSQSCSPSAGSSLSERDYLHGHYRTGKPILENYRLNDLNEGRRDNNRYEVRYAELASTRLPDERQIHRDVIASQYGTTSIDGRRMNKKGRDVSEYVERRAIYGQNRHTYRGRERENGEHTNIRKFGTHGGRQQVAERTVNSISSEKSTSVDRRERIRSRNVREKSSASTEDNLRVKDIRTKDKNFTPVLRWKPSEHSLRENVARRMLDRKTYTRIGGEPTDVRNDEKRKDSRKRDVSAVRRTHQSDPEMVVDTYVARTYQERNRIVSDERKEIRNSEKFERDNRFETSRCIERGIQQSDARRVTDTCVIYRHAERNTNVKGTEIRNFEKYNRNNMRERSVSIDRNVRQSDARRVSDKRVYNHDAERSTRIGGEMREIRNHEIKVRDTVLEKDFSRKLHRGYSEPRNVRDKHVTRSHDERNMYLKDERTNVRNPDAREDARERMINGIKDVRRSSSREELNAYTKRDKRTNNKKNEWYSRDTLQERSVLTEQKVRESNERRILGERFIDKIKDERVNSQDRSSERDQTENRKNSGQLITPKLEERNLNVRYERANILRAERRSRDHTQNKQRNPMDERLIMDESFSPGRKQLNTRGIDRNLKRNTERYVRGTNRDKFVSPQHNIRQDVNRLVDVRNREQRIATVQEIHTHNRNKYMILRDKIDERIMTRRIPDARIARNRMEGYTNARNERTHIKNNESYLREARSSTRDETASLGVTIRQQREVRITLEHITRNRKELNTNNQGLRIGNVEMYPRNIMHAKSDDREVRRSDVIRNYIDDIAHRREERNANKRYLFLGITNGQRNRLEGAERNLRKPCDRIIDEYVSRNHEDQYKRARDEIRNVRYARDSPREKDLSIKRDVSFLHQRSKLDTERYIARARDERRTDIRDERDAKRITSLDDIQNQPFARIIRQSRTDAPILGLDSRRIRGITRYQDSQNYRTEENLRIRKSNENLRRSVSDINREIEPETLNVYRSSRNNMDMERETSRNTEFANRLRTMNRYKATETEKPTSTLLYWKHLFYAIQGIYMLGVFIEIFRQKKNDKKASTMRWLNPVGHIKVD